jgi:FlgD Ig-like domain
MKTKLFFLFTLVSIFSLLISTTWEIKQDGTGDFTTIQEGIDESSNADTVLVYSGTYLENINFNSKNITVASLFLTTGDEQYINQTIIDGNQCGSCVRIKSGENETTVLCGFTLINGNGSTIYADSEKYGGGIQIRDSQPNIEHCIIESNSAFSGGGIFCSNSEISIKGVTIKNNHAFHGGGGIVVGTSTIDFNENELCNIYLNYAALGCDIAKGDSNPPMLVIVDTFTVAEPDGYFIWNYTSTGLPLNDVTLISQNAKLEPVNADLYVATYGDNNNSGLTLENPLKTINFAQALIQSDSLHPNTIHIANGIYSKSVNDQYFPLGMRGYVSLVGESRENTILDAEHNTLLICDSKYSSVNYTISDLTLSNAFRGNSLSACIAISTRQLDRYVNMSDIIIAGCLGADYSTKLFYIDVYMNNIIIDSNYSGFLWALNSYQQEQSLSIENATISNNHQYNPTSISSDALPQLNFGMVGTKNMDVNITNFVLKDNIQTQSDWPETSSGIVLGDSVNLNLVNCTIGNNSSPGSGGVIMIESSSKGSTANIYNSILYGNSPGEIYINNEFSGYPATLNIQNSLVAGGEVGIVNNYSWNTVNWQTGNLDEDPLWLGNGEYPYHLQSNSPCIDAGTLDLPAGIELPELDLAGNPRIYGDTVDMGAYEWQGVGVEGQEIPQFSLLTPQILNYPNPFNPSTTIKLELAEAGKIELAIFNIKGQKVKTLLECVTAPGSYECIWNGKDELGKSVSSGQYHVKLKQNGKETATKIMLLK